MYPNFSNYLTKQGHFSEQEKEVLIRSVQFKSFRKGELLQRAGEVCNYVFFIEEGLTRSYTIDKIGKEHVIQFAPEGWMITDRSSMFFSESSAFFIEAIEDSEVALLEDHFLEKLSCDSVDFSRSNIQALQKHIRTLQQRINMLLGASAEERYIQFVKTYPGIIKRVPQWMIASYLGITPESLSRVRRRLVQKGSE